MKASDIMRLAGVVLLDEDYVRWPLSELAAWIDDGVAAIVSVKPSAASTTLDLNLVRGTKQTLPDDERVVQLLGIIRNAGRDGAGGRMVRSTTRAEVDANEPRWHDPSYVPFRKEVRQFMFDENLQRTFYVFPGNDGTGVVEAAVSQLPQKVADQKSGEGLDLDSWNVVVGIADFYQPPLLDYVLYRAFSKDDPAANASRATIHYQAFATALGIKSQVEKQTSPRKQ